MHTCCRWRGGQEPSVILVTRVPPKPRTTRGMNTSACGLPGTLSSLPTHPSALGPPSVGEQPSQAGGTHYHHPAPLHHCELWVPELTKNQLTKTTGTSTPKTTPARVANVPCWRKLGSGFYLLYYDHFQCLLPGKHYTHFLSSSHDLAWHKLSPSSFDR